jgi:hypothetical protein
VTTFSANSLSDYSINDSGWVAIGAFSSLPSGTSNNGIWINAGASNQPLALINTDGPLGPGLGAGVSFIPVMNVQTFTHSGGVLLVHSVNQSDPVQGGQGGAWSLEPSGNVPLARVNTTGPLGPGIGGDWRYTSILRGWFDRDGRVILDTTLRSQSLGVTRSGFVKQAAGGNTLLALTGTDGAGGPQAGAGVVFDRFAGITAVVGPYELAAVASIAGPSIDATNSDGIWLLSDAGSRRSRGPGSAARWGRAWETAWCSRPGPPTLPG